MTNEITGAYRPIKMLKGIAVVIASFAVLGTVSALWDNPLFMRMTPTGTWEVGLLATLSILLGVYVVVRRPFCSIKTAGAGGVLGFLGVACPVCNKVLLLLFGGELLLTYYEPVRVYVAITLELSELILEKIRPVEAPRYKELIEEQIQRLLKEMERRPECPKAYYYVSRLYKLLRDGKKEHKFKEEHDRKSKEYETRERYDRNGRPLCR